MVGVTLRRMRKNARLTQADVADICGVVPTTVGRWERGETQIPKDKIESLAEALGVSPIDIEEIRTATEEHEELVHVSSRMDVYRWRNAIARSELGIEARALLSALPVFLDEDAWVVTVSRQQFVDETGVVDHVIEEHWPEVMASGFVENLNPHLHWVLRLVFP